MILECNSQAKLFSILAKFHNEHLSTDIPHFQIGSLVFLSNLATCSFSGQNIMELMQNQLQEGVEKLQSLQKQQQKTLSTRQMLDSQLSENKLVKEEMDKVDAEAKVFKLIGPALVRQDVTEAKGNVDKRISYITGELKRQDDLLGDLDKQQESERERLQALQGQMQKLAQA